MCQNTYMSDPSSNKGIKKIGVVVGGGDGPGLNAVLRSVVISARNRGWKVYGIERGFEGLLNENGVKKMSRLTVRGILHTGGTILGTSNRGNPFKHKITDAKGNVKTVDESDKIVESINKLGLDALIVIGGDGTLGIASDLVPKGVRIIGVPKTIDNDLMETDLTFGFGTAVDTATDAIDKLHATAESHERVMIVEVMGRYAGWISLYSGIAGGADVILLPEIPFKYESIIRKLDERWNVRKRNFAIIVAAEGARWEEGEMIYKAREEGREPRLGGIAEHLAEELRKRTRYETRALVLGHLQRGGPPTSADRLLATRFGAAAVRAVEAGESNVMVAYKNFKITTVPLENAIRRIKTVPIDSDVISTARDLGICLGD